jgi:hypothetical protein
LETTYGRRGSGRLILRSLRECNLLTGKEPDRGPYRKQLAICEILERIFLLPQEI